MVALWSDDPRRVAATIPGFVAAGTLSDDELTISFVAIILVSLLGLVMLTAVVIGARHVRRLNRRPNPPSQMASDRWYEKPLVEPAPRLPDDESADVE